MASSPSLLSNRILAPNRGNEIAVTVYHLNFGRFATVQRLVIVSVRVRAGGAPWRLQLRSTKSDRSASSMSRWTDLTA